MTQTSDLEPDLNISELDPLPKEWRIVRLGKVSILKLGRTPKRANSNYWKNGIIPWVSISDLNNGVVRTTKEMVSRKAFQDVFRGKIVPEGTLLMSFKLTIGKVAILGIEATHNEAIVNITPISTETLIDFLFYMLQSIDYDTYLDSYVKGKTLNKEKLNALPIPMPPLLEQRGIAHVLQTVQRAREATEAVIAAAKKLKRSLMRHLFTYGPVPVDQTDQVKLKDSEIGPVPEKWEIVRLEDICYISTGTTPSTKRTDYYSGSIPFIKTAEITNNIINKASNHINQQAVEDYSLKIYKPGTVFLAMYGQGKTRGQTSLLNIEATTTQNTAALIPQTNLNSKYLWIYLMSQYERLRHSGDHGQISHLNLGYVKEIRIPLPSTTEQSKIASVLSTVDRKIETEQARKAALDNLFKSLLANLMTGKIRVKVGEKE